MNHRKIIAYFALVVIAACAIAILPLGSQKECCLCNSPSHFTPCLIDLETGEILELSLDGPTTTSDTDPSSYAETFSIIRFGNITGIKQTAPNKIELKIPTQDKTKYPALCSKCRNLLPQGYEGRYVIGDLGGKRLIPIIAGTEHTICSHTVAMAQAEDEIALVFQ